MIFKHCQENENNTWIDYKIWNSLEDNNSLMRVYNIGKRLWGKINYIHISKVNPHYKEETHYIHNDKTCQGFKAADDTTEKS